MAKAKKKGFSKKTKQALLDDGWHNWRDFFYVNVLPDKPDDMPLASHVRKSITAFLFSEYGKGNRYE